MIKLLAFFTLLGIATSIHITCRFSTTSWAVIGNAYTCMVTGVYYNGSATHITSYSGVHYGQNSSYSVEMVYFESSYCPGFNLTLLPLGFKNVFYYLIGLGFRNCAFDSLEGRELYEYERLEFFRVWTGNLVRIPSNFFAANRKLRYIDFDSNKLQHVGKGLLDRLPKLEAADFSRNPCIDMYASGQDIPALILALRDECPDVNPFRCFDDFIENFVCDLSYNMNGLTEKIDVIENSGGVGEMSIRSEEIKELREKNAQLEGKFEMFHDENEKLKSEIEEMRKALSEFEDKLNV